jgi:hypothetical protein
MQTRCQGVTGVKPEEENETRVLRVPLVGSAEQKLQGSVAEAPTAGQNRPLAKHLPHREYGEIHREHQGSDDRP